MPSRFVPARFQAPLPHDQLVKSEQPGDEAVPMDVVVVGGGPAGLSLSIELKKLAKAAGKDVEVAVLEKAEELGQHSLSGAVVNPAPFRELFPDLRESDYPFRRRVDKEQVMVLTANRAIRIPTPPPMHNSGNYVASICEIVRWLGEKAEAAGVNLFAGYPVDSLLTEGERVVGVRTTPAGLKRDGSPGSNSSPPTDLAGQVVALCDGTRSPLAQAWYGWQKVSSPNPQIYALGVKEIWETKKPLEHIVHTMGWPLGKKQFGGSFMYPLEPNLVAVGLVVGMDWPDNATDVHLLLQRMKLHPFFKPWFDGGELVEWGAKTIPEGGFYALPQRRVGDGLVVCGDAAGFVEVASLKGIHYAMKSGIEAARAIWRGIESGDTSRQGLASYDAAVDASYIGSDMRKRRNMRLAFKSGFVFGGMKAGLMTLTGGAFPGGQIHVEEDAKEARDVKATEPFSPDGKITFSKVDAVYKSGNATRDDIPSHLTVGSDVPPEVADLYVSMCPAGVYERDGDKLVVNAPNCIDCKATDVIGPRWQPREGGSGPRYKRM
ncbi:MAG: electron-transfer flavoprotein:ubiquinone oxidoreductase [Planctomycetota bacterium]